MHGLSAPVSAKVLVADPQDFDRAELLTERVAGAHSEVLRGSGPSTAHKGGPVPMGPGAAQG